MFGVLFVCTGNICRSPTAEGVFRAHAARAGLLDGLHIDSAGTHGYHVGEPPDPRTQEAARARGYDLSQQRARRVRPSDFSEFDLLVALDRGHLRTLRRMAPPGSEDRLRLLLDFAGLRDRRDVPDPYYGGGADFELVLDLIEAASAGLLEHIRSSRPGR